jgi:hypothetical protein
VRSAGRGGTLAAHDTEEKKLWRGGLLLFGPGLLKSGGPVGLQAPQRAASGRWEQVKWTQELTSGPKDISQFQRILECAKIQQSWKPKNNTSRPKKLWNFFESIEGVNVNHFLCWINFRFGTDFELENLGHNKSWNWIEFLRAQMELVKYPEIHQNYFLLWSSRI